MPGAEGQAPWVTMRRRMPEKNEARVAAELLRGATEDLALAPVLLRLAAQHGRGDPRQLPCIPDLPGRLVSHVAALGQEELSALAASHAPDEAIEELLERCESPRVLAAYAASRTGARGVETLASLRASSSSAARVASVQSAVAEAALGEYARCGGEGVVAVADVLAAASSRTQETELERLARSGDSGLQALIASNSAIPEKVQRLFVEVPGLHAPLASNSRLAPEVAAVLATRCAGSPLAHDILLLSGRLSQESLTSELRKCEVPPLGAEDIDIAPEVLEAWLGSTMEFAATAASHPALPRQRIISLLAQHTRWALANPSAPDEAALACVQTGSPSDAREYLEMVLQNRAASPRLLRKVLQLNGDTELPRQRPARFESLESERCVFEAYATQGDYETVSSLVPALPTERLGELPAGPWFGESVRYLRARLGTGSARWELVVALLGDSACTLEQVADMVLELAP